MSSESIEFSAKYKNWVVIRKTSIYEDTNPEEIAFALAGIRQSIDKKAFEILNIDTASLDSYAEKLASSTKKSIAGFSEAISKITSTESKAAIEKGAMGKSEHENISRIYLIRKVAQLLNMDFDVNQEMLSKIYPSLKVPKQRGRKAKE